MLGRFVNSILTLPWYWRVFLPAGLALVIGALLVLSLPKAGGWWGSAGRNGRNLWWGVSVDFLWAVRADLQGPVRERVGGWGGLCVLMWGLRGGGWVRRGVRGGRVGASGCG